MIPVRKRFDNFEDTHVYYSILGSRKSSSEKDVDAAFKREKKIFKRIASKAHPDKLSNTPNKENVTKMKRK